MTDAIETTTLPQKPKLGRPFGTTKPNAARHDVEKSKNMKHIANEKFKQSAGYVRVKIKMNCQKHNVEVPTLTGKTLEELNQIHFNIKLNNFNNSNDKTKKQITINN